MPKKVYFSVYKDHLVADSPGRDVLGKELPPITIQFREHFFETADKKLQDVIEGLDCFTNPVCKSIYDSTDSPGTPAELKTKYTTGVATTSSGPGLELQKENEDLKRKLADAEAKLADGGNGGKKDGKGK